MTHTDKIIRLQRTVNLIELVRRDYQLTKGHEDYLGFINLSTDGLMVSESADLEAFVSLYNDAPTLVKMLLYQVGLYEAGVSLDETIICDYP